MVYSPFHLRCSKKQSETRLEWMASKWKKLVVLKECLMQYIIIQLNDPIFNLNRPIFETFSPFLNTTNHFIDVLLNFVTTIKILMTILE